ncbi:hypothetical protein [Sinorhizobium meliloti]|uniref:hypothetical protein n=1 Tax=Rhizobium meliloti TaxID=382 RepID=UPI00129793DD|nr:hypothetical protein [Sinorhizobium meliloti]MQU84773.1 hypothetical protein [Sinorhizobium meliloti]MQU86420.1 hypothetical protein [Sinorhizobium meliloti]
MIDELLRAAGHVLTEARWWTLYSVRAQAPFRRSLDATARHAVSGDTILQQLKP